MTDRGKSKYSLPRLILTGPSGDPSTSGAPHSHSINSTPNNEEFPNIIRTNFNSIGSSSNPNQSTGNITNGSYTSEHSGEKKRKYGKMAEKYLQNPKPRTRSKSAGILEDKQDRRGSVGTRSAQENPLGSRDNLNLPNNDGCALAYSGHKSKSGQLTTTMHMSENDLMKELKDLSMRLQESSSHYGKDFFVFIF